MQRTQRLLSFASQLDEKSRKAFDLFPVRQIQSEQYLLAYVDAAEKFNGGVVESDEKTAAKRLDAVCTSVAGMLGIAEGSVQRKADLKKWAEGNDRRGFKLLRDLVDPEKDFKAWRKTQVICPLSTTDMIERTYDPN